MPSQSLFCVYFYVHKVYCSVSPVLFMYTCVEVDVWIAMNTKGMPSNALWPSKYTQTYARTNIYRYLSTDVRMIVCHLCCSVLHCVAVYCSVLQCVAVCCSVSYVRMIVQDMTWSGLKIFDMRWLRLVGSLKWYVFLAEYDMSLLQKSPIKVPYSARKTYDFKEPTNRSHRIEIDAIQEGLSCRILSLL